MCICVYYEKKPLNLNLIVEVNGYETYCVISHVWGWGWGWRWGGANLVPHTPDPDGRNQHVACPLPGVAVLHFRKFQGPLNISLSDLYHEIISFICRLIVWPDTRIEPMFPINQADITNNLHVFKMNLLI